MEEIIQNIPNISDKVLLHICRHFKNLPPEDLSKLLELGIDRAEIEQELMLVGSKFFSPPFSGIYAIVDYIKKNWQKKEVISFDNDILVSRWVLNKSEYPLGIGNDGLVSLKSLNENEKYIININLLGSVIYKEITDDIVKLISNSSEALQDFAYIKTQQDVNQFNVKYGVNLVLPQNV